MQRHQDLDRVFIISEIHPQHGGDLGNATTMILQSKMAGADTVKIQLYDAEHIWGDQERSYQEISKDQLKDLKAYSDSMGIGLFASVFDTERLDWCEELGFPYYKIASRSVIDENLCRAIIATGKPVFISLGMYDWQTKGWPYKGDNLIYFYCVSKYPTLLHEIEMPEFALGSFLGYSDHTIGIAACLFAVSRGARYIEKHFTLNKGRQGFTEQAHACSMDFDDLRRLRELTDSLSILRTNVRNRSLKD